ncbi:MAG TPA: copper amine oxidase N-terminal domain-containing protein, partial [Clostridia bacterium]|nr:copper amine oxidase N-terminal domain-containing protein [Clostridia bacterium]
MRQRARMIALLSLLVFLVWVVTPVGAADGTKTLKAIFRNLQIVVNGKTLISDKEPFIVDGVTYVPIRLVSEATGATVDWDGAQGRVIITTKATMDQAQIDKIKQESYQQGY